MKQNESAGKAGKNESMRIIGITGGIGSGKSTVSRILKDLGAVVVDADAVARSVTQAGGKAVKELADYFGNEIIREDGELDRAKLASLAFADDVKLNALNSITHKYILEKIHETVESLKKSGKFVITVIDAPIPVKEGFLDLVDEVWVVLADKDSRIKRVMERSGFSHDEVSARIDAQLNDEEYIRLADEVLYNNGSVEDLEQAVVRLFLQKKQEWQR
ncbi:MAG: dephospho-CoA kinase [Bacillota bacterium]